MNLHGVPEKKTSKNLIMVKIDAVTGLFSYYQKWDANQEGKLSLFKERLYTTTYQGTLEMKNILSTLKGK